MVVAAYNEKVAKEIAEATGSKTIAIKCDVTNKEEVDWLLTETAKRAIVECHVRGIINYIASLQEFSLNVS